MNDGGKLLCLGSLRRSGEGGDEMLQLGEPCLGTLLLAKEDGFFILRGLERFFDGGHGSGELSNKGGDAANGERGAEAIRLQGGVGRDGAEVRGDGDHAGRIDRGLDGGAMIEEL